MTSDLAEELLQVGAKITDQAAAEITRLRAELAAAVKRAEEAEARHKKTLNNAVFFYDELNKSEAALASERADKERMRDELAQAKRDIQALLAVDATLSQGGA